jgi:hypothetical protein
MSGDVIPEGHQHPVDRLRRAAQGPELRTAGLEVKGRASAIAVGDGRERPPLSSSLSGRAGRSCGGGDSTRHPEPGPALRRSLGWREPLMISTNTAGAAVVGDRWRDYSACLHTDPEVFFPTAASGSAAARQERQARAVCAGCAVIDQCREWAITSLAHGIAGGMSEDERRTERARRARAARQARAAARDESDVEQVRHLVVGEGSAVAAAAPLRISRSHGQARTRVTEGHRS